MKKECGKCRRKEPEAILGDEGEIMRVRAALRMCFVQRRGMDACFPIRCCPWCGRKL